MCKVALLGTLLVLCFGSVSSSYDGFDYWYSNDDGVLSASITSIGRFRSENNRTDNHTNTKAEDISDWVEYEAENRRAFTPPPFVRDNVLSRLQRETTPAEVWRCAVGPEVIMDCNHCVCLGGQLYLCTANKCQHPDYQGRLVYRPYREKPEAVCIEGEKIKSFDCNKCWCSGGLILCTVRSCSKPRKLLRLRHTLVQDRDCQPGESLSFSGLDRCNTCRCDRLGKPYCTAMSCGQGSNLFAPQDSSGPDVGCVKESWYSLEEGHNTCKECYCIDGKMAFCYMKLCETIRKRNSGYSPIFMMASLKSSCKERETFSDECTRCVCTYKKEWRCYTRMIDRCNGEGKRELQKKTDYQQKSNDKKIRNRGDMKHYYRNNPKSELTNSYEELTTKEKSVEITTRIDVQSINKFEYAKNNNNEYNSGTYEEATTKTIQEQSKQNEDKLETMSGELFSKDVEELPECKEGESFMQSTTYNCQGCFCTADGKWKCYSLKDPCRDTKSSCWVGAFEKNKNIPCSVCYCAKTAKWFCATDELCSQQIQDSRCNSIQCSRGCQKEGYIYGICYKDNCSCV